MVDKTTDTYGLNAKQIAACGLWCRGKSKVDAYLISHEIKNPNRKTVTENARRLFERTGMGLCIDDLLAAVKLEEIISQGKWLRGVVEGAEIIFQKGNYAAWANVQRLIGQATGGLKDTVVVEADGAARDRDLIEAASGLDPELKRLIRRKMGSHDVFETPHLVIDTTKQ